MQIKRVTMATSHGLPRPGTYNTEFSVDNKGAYLDTGVTMNQGADGKGQVKGKSGKAIKQQSTLENSKGDSTQQPL